jgi:hypothetical protein
MAATADVGELVDLLIGERVHPVVAHVNHVPVPLPAPSPTRLDHRADIQAGCPCARPDETCPPDGLDLKGES